MTPDDAIAHLRGLGSAEDAQGAAAYHKVEREYLGVRNPVLSDYARDLRRSLDLETRLSLAEGLWASNIHEGRILAAKLLEQARIRPDDAGAWALITKWVPDFDAWAIADHACISGAKRLIANPDRVADVAAWATSEHMWTKRAALVITLPWARMNNLKPRDQEIREEVLGWAASYVADPEWFIQKCVAWWLRDLSKHDADRVRQFLDAHGSNMKPFARKEAGKYLG